jgi:ribosome-associated heat shock protein Hsp15
MSRGGRDAAAPGEGAGRGTRLDKWLWAARFLKTRALAQEAVEKGRVTVNGQSAKPAREVRPGDVIEIRAGGGLQPPWPRRVTVRALSDVRGPAPVAQALYEEDAARRAEIEAWLAQRRFLADPASSIEQGRPTKRDRRELVAWDDRWSAGID